MPQPLPDDLLEEVLLRLPPQEPAELVRAALVSRRWCSLVSDPGFRRRFREFHRSPPMLGMLCNLYDDDVDGDHVYKIDKARFIPTTAFRSPHTDLPDMRVLDARHGRVLCEKGDFGVLAVWDPITDEVRELPFPQEKEAPWTAAVLCSASGGACDHLDCHDGPFLVVYVCFNCRYGNTIIHTYSSDAAAWSESVVCAQQPYLVNSWMGSVLVGNTLYFGNQMGSTALKYDLELQQTSLIRLPSSWDSWQFLLESKLTITEDGGLGLVAKDDSKLYMWSTKDTHKVDAKWQQRATELKTMFPGDVKVDVTKLGVIGSGVGTIFMRTGDEVYTIDLKTYNVKKVYEGTTNTVFPHMSFYTPALKGTCTANGEEPSSGHSSA